MMVKGNNEERGRGKISFTVALRSSALELLNRPWGDTETPPHPCQANAGNSTIEIIFRTNKSRAQRLFRRRHFSFLDSKLLLLLAMPWIQRPPWSLTTISVYDRLDDHRHLRLLLTALLLKGQRLRPRQRSNRQVGAVLKFKPPGTDFPSDWTTLASSVIQYPEENGRRYHAYRAGRYNFPNDEVSSGPQAFTAR